jgi:hypothetical protein
MAESVSIEDVLTRPGVYFNPQTEVLVVVDDSADLDSEIFNMESFEGSDWVAISDEVPLDEQRRDELLEEFQTHYHPGAAGSVSASEEEPDQIDEDADDQDVGRD